MLLIANRKIGGAAIFVALAALTMSSLASADQTHWWQLIPSPRGVAEVCVDQDYDGSALSPAKVYEFLQSDGQNPRIEEDQMYWLDQAAGTHIHTVHVVVSRDGAEYALNFFRTAVECRTMATYNRENQDERDQEQQKALDKYR